MIDVLGASLASLNDGSTAPDADMFVMTFDSHLQAWQVVKLVCVQRDVARRDKNLHRVIPYSASHTSLRAALADALTLKLGTGNEVADIHPVYNT